MHHVAELLLLPCRLRVPILLIKEATLLHYGISFQMPASKKSPASDKEAYLSKLTRKEKWHFLRYNSWFYKVVPNVCILIFFSVKEKK